MPLDGSPSAFLSSTPKYERRFNLNPTMPITRTTASGIKVTLLPEIASMGVGQGVDAMLHVETGIGWSSDFQLIPLHTVPNSPLYKKYHKPIQIIALMNGTGPGMAGFKGKDVSLSYPNVVYTRPIIKKVMFTLRQRCIIQRIPVSFTLDTTKMSIAKYSQSLNHDPFVTF